MRRSRSRARHNSSDRLSGSLLAPIVVIFSYSLTKYILDIGKGAACQQQKRAAGLKVNGLG
jgi:hypothetical protein